MQFDFVSFTTATTGTGTVTVGSATSSFRTPLQASIPDGTTVEYAIKDGTARESGTGVIGGGSTTLTRVLSQSTTGSLLNLGGTATVFITPIASQYNGLTKPSGVATITVPNGIGRFEHIETVAAVGVTALSLISLSLNPCIDTDENCPEMLNASSITAAAGAGLITVTAAFSELTSGPIKFNWSVV